MTYAARSSVYPELSSSDRVERGFLCCVFLDPRDRAGLDEVSPDAFRSGRHRTIFQAVQDLVGEGATPTADAVRARLEASGTLDRAGGLTYLVSVTQETFSAAMRQVYVKHLRREAARYALEQLGALLSEEAKKPETELEPLCSLAAAMVADVQQLHPDEALTKRRLWTTQLRTR